MDFQTKATPHGYYFCRWPDSVMRYSFFSRTVVTIVLAFFSSSMEWQVVAWTRMTSNYVKPPPTTTTLRTAKLCDSKRSGWQKRRPMRVMIMKMHSSSNVQPRWWNKCDISELTYDSALRALEAYHRKYGDLAIPGRFVVPSTNGKRNIPH